MKTSAKFIVLQPSVHSTTTASQHRAWLALLSLIFLSTFTFTLLTTRPHTSSSITTPRLTPTTQHPQLLDALVYYAAVNTSCFADRMSAEEVGSIAAVIRRCEAPCNLLVFGFTHETLLWHTMNHKGHTVFVDRDAYSVSKLEEKHPFVEAYDVQFTTKVSELHDLIDYYKTEVNNECRPVQNLLFSECKLAINDLPNYVYDVAWDVIIIDGPKGHRPDSPGRSAPIYTAAVIARSKRGGSHEGTHVFVHETGREVEKVCGDEFLCGENLVETVGELGHYVVPRMEEGGNERAVGFCSGGDGSEFSPESN